jgi:hypothetical protein
MSHGFVSLPFFEVTEAARIIGITWPEWLDPEAAGVIFED